MLDNRQDRLLGIQEPADLRDLDYRSLEVLAQDIRELIISSVARTGGHLGANLGVVELTLALHRVFHSPVDRIVFDTGHQAYVHKMLTGRADRFDTLRQPGGISGYPARAESVHDLVENSHASTALSYADGLAKAAELRGERRCVVAVVGDGALTGGMCWEALNNIAAARRRPVVIVVNDNGRSYAPTPGRLAAIFRHVRPSVRSAPPPDGPAPSAIDLLKEGFEGTQVLQEVFAGFGLTYLGPVPGHDLPALEQTLARARELGGPVVVHVVTRKGSGYPPAEEDAEDCLHSPPPFDPPTGQPLRRTGAKWTAAFSAELRELATGRPDLVVITAAMPGPTGTAAAMADRPDHFFDVGLAEQHAVTSAAGLAMGGMHPVVAVYSTFLNRAFDQVLLDVGLHRLPVTFVADRAGITGPDGPSHHGIWDMAVFGIVPGMRIAAPRDAATLRDELREALQISTGPTLVRFPTGELPASLPALRGTGGTDLLYRSLPDDVLVVAVGPFAHIAVEAAGLLTERGYGVTVVDPRWPVPVPDEVVRMAPDFRMVLVVEDGVRTGGVGDAVARALRDAGVPTPVQSMGVSNEWHPQAPRAEILRRLGLTGDGLARRVTECLGSPRRSDPGT